MKRFTYVNATSVAEATSLAKQGAMIKHGGTDVLLLIKERIVEPDRIVNLQQLDALNSIEVGKSIKIGAGCSLATVGSDARIMQRAAALAIASGEAATPQIRNMATVGGNLCQRPRCWYFRSPDFACRKKGTADACPAAEGENQYHAILGDGEGPCVHPSNLGPALLALDAQVHIASSSGSRTLSIQEFFTTSDVTRENSLAAGEIITGVEVPTCDKSVYIEEREKFSYDWPLVVVSAVRREGRVRVALGAVAPRPWRSDAIDAAATQGNAEAAADAALADSHPLGNNGYKVKILRVLIRRALEAIG